MAELADAPDSKSGSLMGVWVRVPPWLLRINKLIGTYMKRVFLLFVLLCTGCGVAVNGDDVAYTRSNDDMKLAITHRHAGGSLKINIDNAEDAKRYKERLAKLIKEIEKFEDELSIREKK